MKFTVTWVPAAELRLMSLWIDSRFSAQITAAIDRLDTMLASKPLEVGESRSGQLRIAFEYPAPICFRVDLRSQKVVVLDVWLF